MWLQRRRRFTVSAVEHDKADDDDPPTELPPPVAQLRRALAHHPELTLHADQAEQAAAVPELAALPPGGIGLQGDGAHGATRAALVAALASGGPHHPDKRGEVVIDAATLATLIGSDDDFAATLGPWPRLHIADDIDSALTIIEAQLLHRCRILDEHCLSDLDTLPGAGTLRGGAATDPVRGRQPTAGRRDAHQSQPRPGHRTARVGDPARRMGTRRHRRGHRGRAHHTPHSLPDNPASRSRPACLC